MANHAGLNAQRLRGFGDCRGGSGKLDDVIGIAAGGEIGFRFFEGHGDRILFKRDLPISIAGRTKTGNAQGAWIRAACLSKKRVNTHEKLD